MVAPPFRAGSNTAQQFECKRGVRQGDPISPLFYLFGSDLLQSAINDLVHQGALHRPIETRLGLSNHPICGRYSPYCSS
jgi:hypothetical protein